MELNKLFTDDRAISPVVGVALLIAIAVILATVIGAVVLNLGPGGADAPQADMNAQYDQGAGEITMNHRGGDALVAEQINVTSAGEEITLANHGAGSLNDGELTAGESVTINEAGGGPGTGNFSGTQLSSGEEVTVIWQSSNGGKEVIVDTFEA